jgi:transposase
MSSKRMLAGDSAFPHRAQAKPECLRCHARNHPPELPELKETFQHLWHYRSLLWARTFLDYWCMRAMRSRLEPMKKVARMLRAHEELLLNWFRAKAEISSGAVEGLNNKIRVVTRRSYGFRTYEAMEIALYRTLGRLPEPETTHRFC